MLPRGPIAEGAADLTRGRIDAQPVRQAYRAVAQAVTIGVAGADREADHRPFGATLRSGVGHHWRPVGVAHRPVKRSVDTGCAVTHRYPDVVQPRGPIAEGTADLARGRINAQPVRQAYRAVAQAVTIYVTDNNRQTDEHSFGIALVTWRCHYRIIVLPGDGDGDHRRIAAALAVAQSVAEAVGSGCTVGQMFEPAVWIIAHHVTHQGCDTLGPGDVDGADAQAVATVRIGVTRQQGGGDVHCGVVFIDGQIIIIRYRLMIDIRYLFPCPTVLPLP